jgi:8-oxo-dGTP diphosphatase
MMHPKIVDPGIVRSELLNRRITDVAVGVLIRPEDNAFLLTSRPQGKPYAGYWEFPGGKLELGEAVLDALKRELLEEIGIEVQEASLWKVDVFDYPHAIVRLNFCKVSKWGGTMDMLENQNFIWSQLPVCVSPVLPGTFPVLAWLALERGFLGATTVSPVI